MKTEITIKIDNLEVKVPEGTTVFEAARKANINIPHLCQHDGLSIYAAFRVCVVEVLGESKLVASCSKLAENGMHILTNTERIRRSRRLNIELLLANHPEDCFTCERNQICELRKIAYNLGIRTVRFRKERKYDYERDISSPAIVRDSNKCVLCSRCTRVCQEIQSVGAIDFVNRGGKTRIFTSFNKGLDNVECVACGQCILACPTGALREKEYISDVWDAIANEGKYVVVQTAPAVRAAIGEEFGMKPGSLVTGKMVSALRRLGFDQIFDTQFTADLTIIEEANELLSRIEKKGVLPMITSCSPGWIKYIEHFYPNLLEHLSTCKSPQQMFGAVAKTYYAKKINKKPEDIYVVSIMPCTAKKYEAQRPEMNDSGVRDVDAVLTTREIARMIKEAGVNFVNLEDEDFDFPLGISTGAGTIFGTTGGVMEAALRTAYEKITGKQLDELEFDIVRGMQGIKKAKVSIGGTDVNVAVAHGLSNAKTILEEINSGQSNALFVEIMTCPGGCIGGGGQPIWNNFRAKNERAKALYEEDKNKQIRKSHDNPVVKKLYEEFLGEPNSKLAHELLHTHYTKRNIYSS